jgi:hypothetical protein
MQDTTSVSRTGNFETQKRLVSKDTSPRLFFREEPVRLNPKIPSHSNSAGGGI